MKSSTIRIGSGTMAQTDRVDAAVDIAERGEVQYICFDRMAEKTMPHQALARLHDPTKGYDLDLEDLFRAVLPACLRNGIKLIGNYGGVNPQGAKNVVEQLLKELGYTHVKIGTVTGDDVLDYVKNHDLETQWGNIRLSEVPGEIISASAYLGAAPIVDALSKGADIVITGRVADACLYLAPMIYEFGWPDDDLERIGGGLTIGHLLECSGLVTGGWWIEPGLREVPDPHNIGYPIVQLDSELKNVTITKTPGTGGILNVNTLSVHLGYEVNDPTGYVTPDAIVDLTKVYFEQAGENVVRIHWLDGPRAGAKPEKLKAIVGINEGYAGEALVVYGGWAAYEKAKMSAEIVKRRFIVDKIQMDDYLIEFIGVNATLGSCAPEPKEQPNEIILRVVARTQEYKEAKKIAKIADYMSMLGPYGATERYGFVKEVLGVYPVLVPRQFVTEEVNLTEVC